MSFKNMGQWYLEEKFTIFPFFKVKKKMSFYLLIIWEHTNLHSPFREPKRKNHFNLAPRYSLYVPADGEHVAFFQL